ncbi:MAG: sodium:calcium antiporter, partial [Pseudomonadota bacterium]
MPDLLMQNPLLQLALGFILLAVGAEVLVRAAEHISRRPGISGLFVGIFVVSLGTAAPELFLMKEAIQQGSPEIGVGAIVGSNISNILFVMALGALISPMLIRGMAIYRDGFFLIFAILMLILVTAEGREDYLITPREGFFLIAAFVIYILYTFVTEKVQVEEFHEPVDTTEGDYDNTSYLSNPAVVVFLVVFGIVAGGFLLIKGSFFIINGSVQLASGDAERMKLLSLSLVAIGASLPEIAATIIASYRRNTDLIVGNLLGSSIINIFAVMGIMAAGTGTEWLGGTDGGIP